MTRSHEHEIEIEAPIEAVWRAVTDADELTRWFAESAGITPGEGGTYRVSWGEGLESQSRITAWEPPRRLRLVGGPGGDAGDEVWQLTAEQPIVEEWTLEARGDVTVLRLVDSGIPDSPDWDGFYEGTRAGWDMTLLGLRHYLERHPGQARRVAGVKLRSPLPRPEAQARLLGPDGLGLERLDGGRYRAVPVGGDVLEGRLLLATPDHGLIATVETLGDGLLSIGIDSTGQGTMVWVWLSTFGGSPSPAALAERLEPRLALAVEGVPLTT